jgi:hypothetical protein
MKKSFTVFLFTISFCLQAQLSYTGFEGYADETVFNQSRWTAEGFTVPWVNGFDVNRAHIDNAYAKSGTSSLRIFYPAGNYGPVTTGSGAQAPLMVTPANQYYISYWVRFSDNFSWGNTSEGGKLPGLAGGGRCSGCANCTGSNGFTARLMWRTGGRLVLYLYHLDKVNPPCGDDITLKLSGVDYYITKGQWFQVIERVKVNTGTNHDGEVELWINEQPALLKTGIQFVSNGDQVDNLYFSTFHGGSNAGWGPTVDSYTWFDDIKISTNPSDIFSSLFLNNAGPDQKEKSNTVVQLYPLPARINSTISISLEDEKIHVQWLDLPGNLQADFPNSNSSFIPTPDVPPGMYLLRISSQDQVYSLKVLLE